MSGRSGWSACTMAIQVASRPVRKPTKDHSTTRLGTAPAPPTRMSGITTRDIRYEVTHPVGTCCWTPTANHQAQTPPTARNAIAENRVPNCTCTPIMASIGTTASAVPTTCTPGSDRP
jgi:hypothetical protein